MCSTYWHYANNFFKTDFCWRTVVKQDFWRHRLIGMTVSLLVYNLTDQGDSLVVFKPDGMDFPEITFQTIRLKQKTKKSSCEAYNSNIFVSMIREIKLLSFWTCSLGYEQFTVKITATSPVAHSWTIVTWYVSWQIPLYIIFFCNNGTRKWSFRLSWKSPWPVFWQVFLDDFIENTLTKVLQYYQRVCKIFKRLGTSILLAYTLTQTRSWIFWPAVENLACWLVDDNLLG